MSNPTGKRQQGFTVQEMLIVIAISVILLGVSLVGVVAYVRHLQLTELDNAAREIFLAAQNRAILIGSDKVKQAAVKSGEENRIDHVEIIPSDGSGATTQISVYYVHSSEEAAMEELLPQEAIDPTLWEGDFYIAYEPESASVVDVFYSDSTLPVEGDFADFYMKWRHAEKKERMKSRPMIGYYGGESAESGTALSLRTPVIQITNGNDLQVQVTHWVPRTLQMLGEAHQVKLEVTLEYKGETIPLALEKGTQEEKPEIAYLTYVTTWTLESLEEGSHFYNLFSPAGSTLTYGEDFTVVAQVSYEGTRKVNGAEKTAQDNSLFAKDSGGDTAYITCLRHLQNLDETFSQVEGKTQAQQLGDVEQVGDYRFQPVVNEELKSYDGGGFAITGLTVQSGENEPSGVFGQMQGTERNLRQLKNIHLVDASVTGGTAPTGALLGEGEYVSLTGCQVYWNNRREDGGSLQQLLGNSQNGLRYRITGRGMVGGLAGSLTDGTITQCSASTLVSSDLVAGGLVGQGQSVEITQSYEACYLQAPNAAGLVGQLNVGPLDVSGTIEGSYAVGFVQSPEEGMAAGLCLGGGNGTVRSSYSAMLFTTGNVNNFPLCQNGGYQDTHYLDSDQFGFPSDHKDLALSYEKLLDESQWDSLFGHGIFDSLSAAQSHPYNLQTTLSLTTYRYPGLPSLEHWGDWGAQFQRGSLVYYERYKDGSYGFSGGDVSHLKDDQLVTEDGYAVAYQSTDSISSLGATLEVTYQRKMGEETEKFTYQKETDYYVMKGVQDLGKENDYYLLPLPAQVVNTTHASSNFYQKITIQQLGEDRVKQYYYNPHFAHDPRYAIAILDYEEGLDLDQMARQLPVLLRSPRHFWDLSSFDAYFASENQYRFLQHLDLDYDVYDAYELFTEANWRQHPVGIGYQSPFRGNYNGGFHEIRGVQLATTDLNGKECSYVGLFGYSTGVIQDVVYQMDGDQALQINRRGNSTQPLYVGGLLGYNGGTVENCAVYGGEIRASCYEQSIVYLGGLVGLNEGYVHSSTAQTKTVTAQANLSDAYAGSFAGRNGPGGTIDQCYGVGKVDVSRARYGTVYACGFAGRNEATIRRSYAAAALLAEGGALRFGFCADPTYDCVYLDQGNFSYLGENYGAQYEDNGATSVTWAQLAGMEESTAVDAMGMGGPVAAVETGDYPYPGTLVGDEGTYIHYGAWPDRMDLGSMGVYYWEELVIDGVSSYHLSAISDGGNQAIYSSTLSDAHGDNGAVTQYGYGYFHQRALNQPMLKSSGIGYQKDQVFFTGSAKENGTVNEALSALMGGRYVFHSYDTWDAGAQKGLYVQGNWEGNTGQPVGTWTLWGNGRSLRVNFNPFFADAMSLSGGAAAQGTPIQLPGTRSNPYEVRSIDQLQFINWNANIYTTDQRMDNGNSVRYPYLSYGSGGSWTVRSFYWEQTHDLKGEKGVIYTPIAEVYDESDAYPGNLFGWFGGTYDGNDYMIADVNIKGKTESSCVGLFGAVFNGTLKNIVLYSTDGKATVEGNNSGESRWYAIGGLAGLAGSNQGSAVINCTVAGYTIKDTHQSTKGGGWGGTGLGGLIGVADMDLTGCSAVTNIYLNSRDNDNVRVGGLVGSCQGSINSCYSGGNITVDPDSTATDMNTGPNAAKDPKGIYVGGVVGGIYMKPLQVGGRQGVNVGQSGQELQNTLENCYTYTQLPDADVNRTIEGLYAVGGSGDLSSNKNDGKADHGWTNYKNTYYLGSVVLANNSGGIQGLRTDIREPQVDSLTYDQMADKESANGLLQKLNQNRAGFSTVTTQTDQGDPLDGRYSFGSDPSLLGKDYPFPTILTQSSDLVESGLANVHYGDWPLEGIRRPGGALPVPLDLFADYSEEKQGAVWEETFTLSGVEPGGQWQAESAAPEIAQPELIGKSNNGCTVQIKALQAGTTTVTVSYSVNGKTYALDVTVNVTALLRLAAADPLPVTVFPQERVEMALELRDGENKPLPDALQEQIQLTSLTAESDPTYFALVETDAETMSLAAESGQALGTTQMTLAYGFTYGTGSYQATSTLSLEVKEAEVQLPALEFVLQTGVTEQKKQYTAQDMKLLVNGVETPTESIQIVEVEEVGEELRDMIWAQWAVDSDGTAIPGTVEVTAYFPQTIYPSVASVRLRIAFQYEGRTHIQWQQLQVNLRDRAEGSQP